MSGVATGGGIKYEKLKLELKLGTFFNSVTWPGHRSV